MKEDNIFWSNGGNKKYKSLRPLVFSQMVVHKRKNKWKRIIYFGGVVVCKLKKKKNQWGL